MAWSTGAGAQPAGKAPGGAALCGGPSSGQAESPTATHGSAPAVPLCRYKLAWETGLSAVCTRREDGGWELSLRGPQRPAAVHFVRGGAPFAAVIPGDSVVEQVLTSGISSFL